MLAAVRVKSDLTRGRKGVVRVKASEARERWRYVPFLDGERQHHCFEADEEEGWVVRAVLGEDGKAVMSDCGRPLTEKVYGKVTIAVLSDD